jgi:hypothetical protein
LFQKGKLTGVRVAKIISFEVNRKREHARMKIVGIIVIVFGIADIGISYLGGDLWGEYIGVQLPDLIWSYSGFIEVAIGYGLMKLAGKGQDEEGGKEDESGS